MITALSSSGENSVGELSQQHTPTSTSECAATSDESPPAPSYTYIRISLFQCGGAWSGSNVTQTTDTERRPKKRDYRGDLLLPCRSGTTYTAWVRYLEQQLVQFAVFHAGTNATRVERAAVQSVVETHCSSNSNSSSNGAHHPSLCARCFRSPEMDVTTSSGRRGAVPSSSPILQVVELCKRRRRRDGLADSYEAVPLSQWDSKTVESELDASSSAVREKYEKFRVFFCLNTSPAANPSEPSPADTCTSEVIMPPTATRAAPFTVEVVDKVTQAKRVWRLAAEGPSVCHERAASANRGRGATLQDSVLQRLADTRGLRVERVADRQTGVALLPCYDSSVVASLFPQLSVQVVRRQNGSNAQERHPVEHKGRGEAKKSALPTASVEKTPCMVPTWERALETSNSQYYGLHRHRLLHSHTKFRADDDEDDDAEHSADTQTLISMSDFTDTLSEDMFGLASTERGTDVSAIRDVPHKEQYAHVMNLINTIDSDSRQRSAPYYLDGVGENSNATAAVSHLSFGNELSNLTKYNPLSDPRQPERPTVSQQKPTRLENAIFFTSSSSSSASPAREEPVPSSPAPVQQATTKTPTPKKPTSSVPQEPSCHKGDSLQHINDVFVYEVDDDEEPSRSATKNSTPSRGVSRDTAQAVKTDSARKAARTGTGTPAADKQPRRTLPATPSSLPHLHTSTPRRWLGAKMSTPTSQPPRLLEAIINSQRRDSPFTVYSQTPPPPGGNSPFVMQKPKSYYCYSPAPTQLIHKRDELDSLTNNQVSPHAHSTASSTVVVHEAPASRGNHQTALPFQTAESIAERIMRGHESAPATQPSAHPPTHSLTSVGAQKPSRSPREAPVQSTTLPTPPRRAPIFLEMEDLLSCGSDHDAKEASISEAADDTGGEGTDGTTESSESSAERGSEYENDAEKGEQEEEEGEQQTSATTSPPTSLPGSPRHASTPPPRKELIAELSEGDMEEYGRRSESPQHTVSPSSRPVLTSLKRPTGHGVGSSVSPKVKRLKAEPPVHDDEEEEEEWTVYSPMVVTQQDLPVYVGMDSDEEEEGDDKDFDQYVHLP